MPDLIPDFWPQNIGETTLITPASLLKEEASYLGPKTKQLVKAEVRSSTASHGRFVHNFTLVVPALNNYQYQLFQVLHPITLYPVQLAWQGVIYNVANQE